MASVLDMKSKEEKDAELDRKIEALRKKNEALVKRHQMIEEDRRMAEQEGIAVTTPRKAKHLDGEPDKARKEKENFSITLDVSAGEKRVVNDGKLPKASQSSPRSETSHRSPTQRISGRTGPSSGGRTPQADQHLEPYKVEEDGSHPSERATRGRRSQLPDMPRRSPRTPTDDSHGERWSASSRGAERGGRSPGRGGGMLSRGGGHGGPVDGIAAPDRKVKEWEEKRKQNIEKMNEEMEKIAEYERSQRDGVREKNPIRNFLDDPRRTGPIADVDRKEGSRRHNRNWGGADFEKVKTGMDREKESHGRRPGGKNQMDMTMSMTGKERAEYVRWKQERDQIDQERLARHRKPTGQWRREWDAEKTDSMFKEGATPHVEEEPVGRRDQGKRGAPKPPTMAEFLPESLKRPQRKNQNRSRAVKKPYNMHDSRWEVEEEEEEDGENEKYKPLTEEKEKETCVEKAEIRKPVEPQKRMPEMSAAVREKKHETVADDDSVEDDEEWTDTSGDEEDDEDDVEEEDSLEAEVDHKAATANAPSATPKEQRLPKQAETPKLTMPPPNVSADDRAVESKPTSPFSPEGHCPVTDWGEEMELLSPRGSSSEDSPPQAGSTRGSSEDAKSPNFSPSGSAQNQNPTIDAVKNLTPDMESESVQSTETKTSLEETPLERLPDGNVERRTKHEETSSSAGETTAVEKTSLSQERSFPAEEGTSPAEEGTSPAEEGTSPAEEGTSPTEEETSSSEEGTSSTEEGTYSAEEGTYRAGEGTSRAEEGTSHAEAVTTVTTEVTSPAIKETSPVKDTSPAADETSTSAENSSAVSNTAEKITKESPPIMEMLDGAAKSVHIADFETQSMEIPSSS
ncbi:coiled-coil domain-containing protein 9 isoform X2 [Eleutherodactylus coqui]|uniref:coiled-coil domain-containing protein 9 isoform X2 n=1 Tax=Eleutherodactylus coqui TaxID=57060 RepID=UPI00346225CE